MSTITKTTTITKCDICNKSDVKILKNIEIPITYFMDLVSMITFSPKYQAPYAKANGDVCEECFFKNLIHYLKIRNYL